MTSTKRLRVQQLQNSAHLFGLKHQRSQRQHHSFVLRLINWFNGNATSSLEPIGESVAAAAAKHARRPSTRRGTRLRFLLSHRPFSHRAGTSAFASAASIYTRSTTFGRQPAAKPYSTCSTWVAIWVTIDTSMAPMATDPIPSLAPNLKTYIHRVNRLMLWYRSQRRNRSRRSHSASPPPGRSGAPARRATAPPSCASYGRDAPSP